MAQNVVASKIQLKTSELRRFVRLRVVPTRIPQEKLNCIIKSSDIGLIDQTSGSSEHLMPCGMRYPEPIRCKPNFFIPILYVCSYIAPFFILMVVNSSLHAVPGVPKLLRHIHNLDFAIPVYGDVGLGICMLLFIGTVLAVGVVSATLLAKSTKLRAATKFLIWFAIVFSVSVAECLLAPLGHYVKLPAGHYVKVPARH
jgi:hypothetical protein